MEQTDVPSAPASFDRKLQNFSYTNATPSISTVGDVQKQTRITRQNSRKPAVQDDNAKVTKSRVTKRKTNSARPSNKYAPPSQYAHLKPLTDILEPNLICVFVGFNPGVQTATAGHAYAHPSNLFWKLLHASGLTDRQLKPQEDVDLPRLFTMGNTNLVSRPTRSDAELSKEEQAAGVSVLDAKIRRYKPEAVVIVGKSIWENIWRFRYGKKPGKGEFKTGWQEERHNMGLLPVEGVEEEDDDVGDWAGARVFVATSTSGLDASTSRAQKEEVWRPLGEWVQQRRRERAAAEAS